MQPLVPYLLGADHPDGRRLTDVQPCLRSRDIDDVGDNRHTTFFEMLGNWSLGDYFKREQIEGLWTFLVDIVGLDPRRIYVSVFAGDDGSGIPRDEESADIWAELFARAGVSNERIVLGTEERGNEVGNQGARIAYYGAKNWWSRAGDAEAMPEGEPGGPDTEIFYYFPQVEHDTRFGAMSHQNSDGGQFMEIGNSVFMQFSRSGIGFAPLPSQNVDFGGGLERIAAAAIDSPDVYRVSTLWPIIERLQEITGKTYDDETATMRIVADHIRGAVFLIADGVTPSSKEHGYVLRRLVRRAIRFAHGLDAGDGAMTELAGVVWAIYADAYPDIAEDAERIATVLQKEERAFRRTLGKGLREVRRLGKEDRVITGADIFVLLDRFGFPMELSSEEVVARGLVLDTEWRKAFDQCLREQRERSQAGSKLGVH